MVVNDKTTVFRMPEKHSKVATVLREVYFALQEKGYNPVGQIVGYLLTGDPTYITSHNKARNLITELERDEILEELIASYLDTL